MQPKVVEMIDGARENKKRRGWSDQAKGGGGGEGFRGCNKSEWDKSGPLRKQIQRVKERDSAEGREVRARGPRRERHKA